MYRVCEVDRLSDLRQLTCPQTQNDNLSKERQSEQVCVCPLRHVEYSCSRLYRYVCVCPLRSMYACVRCPLRRVSEYTFNK